MYTPARKQRRTPRHQLCQERPAKATHMMQHYDNSTMKSSSGSVVPLSNSSSGNVQLHLIDNTTRHSRIYLIFNKLHAKPHESLGQSFPKRLQVLPAVPMRRGATIIALLFRVTMPLPFALDLAKYGRRSLRSILMRRR